MGLHWVMQLQMLSLLRMLAPTFSDMDSDTDTDTDYTDTVDSTVDTDSTLDTPDSGEGRGGLPTLPLSQMLMLMPRLTPTFCMADTDSGEGKLSKECQHNTTTTCPTLPDCYRDTIKVQIEEEIPVLPVYVVSMCDLCNLEIIHTAF